MNNKISSSKNSPLIVLPADALTLMNAASGFFSIYFSFKGEFLQASILLFVAVFFDFFDGRVARLTGKTSETGKYLDSLSDVISFGIAPAFLIFNYTNTNISLILGLLLLLCGILGLARFNASKTIDEYEGMPITTNGIIMPLIILIQIFIIPINIIIIYSILIISSLLMISKIKIKKI